MDETDEILIEFLNESKDMIDESIPKLIDLQVNSENAGTVDIDTLNSIFRMFHSIKGTAAFLDFLNINKATHAAENLLDLYRKKKKDVDSNGIATLLKACDFVHEALDTIEAEGNDEALKEKAQKLIDSLTDVISDHGDENRPPVIDLMAPSAAPEPSLETKDVRETDNRDRADTPGESTADNIQSDIANEMRARFVEEADDILEMSEGYLLSLIKDVYKKDTIVPELFRQIHSFKGNCGFMGLSDMERISHTIETVLNKSSDELDENRLQRIVKVVLETLDVLRAAVVDLSRGGDGRIPRSEEICSNISNIENEKEAGASNATESASATGGQASRNESTRASPTKGSNRVVRRDIRVDLEKLDNLINLVGELVIAQSMVTNNPEVRMLDLESFERSAGHLDRIVRDLQDVAMSVRMIPISGTFRKMIRLVHDLSRKFDKKVSLELLGEETEIDKTVSELIADPLVHIIRNAVDHGLETTRERIDSGKSEVGVIRLEARHEGGEIWVLIQDDGRGLSRKKLLEKGIEKGLVTDDGSGMSDEQVYRLLFEPGFSTAKEVTDVSGRGVGMDVVKRNIEKLKGQIDIQTTQGKGTSFILKIPLTLAIIEGMLVRVGKAKYTIPMLSIRGCIRAEEGTITTPMNDHEVIRIREQLLPIIRLYSLHHVVPDSKELTDGAMVLVEDRKSTVAVFVDEILGQHQTVIKGLSNYMGDVRSVSGCTIMGDGDVSLILDPSGVVSMAKLARKNLPKEVCA